MATSSLNSMVSDYKNMRTIPAVLSVAFIAFGAFAFGAIDAITFNWIDYSFQQGHAVLVSLGVYVVAFMSSETKEFRNYEDLEKALVVAGPVVIVAWEYFAPLKDVIMSLGDPLGAQIAFALTLVSWGVATQ